MVPASCFGAYSVVPLLRPLLCIRKNTRMFDSHSVDLVDDWWNTLRIFWNAIPCMICRGSWRLIPGGPVLRRRLALSSLHCRVEFIRQKPPEELGVKALFGHGVLSELSPLPTVPLKWSPYSLCGLSEDLFGPGGVDWSMF